MKIRKFTPRMGVLPIVQECPIVTSQMCPLKQLCAPNHGCRGWKIRGPGRGGVWQKTIRNTFFFLRHPSLTHSVTTWKQEMLAHLKRTTCILNFFQPCGRKLENFGMSICQQLCCHNFMLSPLAVVDSRNVLVDMYNCLLNISKFENAEFSRTNDK